MPATFTFPREAYGNPQRPFQLVSPDGQFLGRANTDDAEQRIATIRDTIARAFNATFSNLPRGCPFTIGGGLIRDGILGGPVGDIDVWLPANANVSPDVLGGTVVFQVNGFSNGSYTRDISNRWVTEVEVNGIKVNFMKRLEQFQNPTQWFDSLNRSFDTELSMMFMGFMPQEDYEDRECAFENLRGMDYISIPTSLLDHIRHRVVGNEIALTSLGVNEERFNTTSANRMNSRIEKLTGKYELHPTDLFMMDRNDLVAQQVRLSQFMGFLNNLPEVKHAWLNNRADTSVPETRA